MNWISNLMITVILTCVTGSALTIVWVLFYSVSKSRVNIRIIYGILKCVMIGYLVPLFFLLLKWQTLYIDGSEGYLLITTKEIQQILTILFVVWMMGVIILIIINMPQVFRLRNVCKQTTVVSSKEQKVFDEVKRDIGIHRRMHLRKGYSIGVPFISGIIHSTVYLPINNYSQDDLEMILTHELCHCKQGDTFWKPVFAFTCYVYWFNPLVWFVWNQMKRFAEASCDNYCCEKKYNPKRYFELLERMNEQAEKYISSFAPLWYEDENELKWRVICMKRNKIKKVKRFGTVLVVMVAVMFGGLSTYAANLGSEKVYSTIYKETVVSESEELQPENPSKEYTGTIDEFDGMVINEEVGSNDNAKEARNIDWSVSNGSISKSTQFYKAEGSEIYVSVVIEPSDKYVKVGIIQPDTSIRYVYSKGNIAHTFAVKQSGYHRVFISNDSGTKVVASGVYTR